MPRIRIEADLSEENLRAYAAEAARQGVKVECLVEQTVNALLRELDQDERDGQCPMIPS